MAAPVTTLNISLRANASLAASGNALINWDLTAKFEGQAQVRVSYPASGSGDLRIRAYRVTDSTGTPTPDTVAAIDRTIPRVVSSVEKLTIKLGTGLWQLRIDNQDTVNAMDVAVIGATVDAIS